MLHFVKNEREEPTIWRDPADIREEIDDVAHRISSAHTCYAALELACRHLMDTTDKESEAVRALLGTLLGEARSVLDDIDDACGEMNLLQKELRDTRCLLLKMPSA